MRDQQARRQPDLSNGPATHLSGDNTTEPIPGAVWALIEPRPLMREALVGMIGTTGGQPVIGVGSAEDLLARVGEADPRVTLVIFHLSSEPLHAEPFRRACGLLKAHFGAVPVVVLSDRVDLNEVSSAFRAGARGYIPTNNTCPAALWALRHVEAGNVYVPEEVVSSFLTSSMQDGSQAMIGSAAPTSRTFTPRQLQVLTLLREGKPNKIIAYELKMQESTVKVHVREIMKKLKVTNRTEAAFRAGQLLANVNGETGIANGTGTLGLIQR